MTYAPATLRATAAYWTAQGGVNLGIVGDTSHIAKGVSYHLGRDALLATAYSIKTARDKAGLSNAASAMDFGRLNGSLTQLRNFSKWLVDQARHNAPGTYDMREIIYSPDGVKVLRWDRERGYQSAPQGGEADNTHLTHTHVSWYRDAEFRDHTTAIRPYFGEADMGVKLNLAVTHDPNPYDAIATGVLKTGALQRVSDGASVALAAGTSLGVVQKGTIVGGTAIVATNHLGELHIAPVANVTLTAIAPPTTTPPPDDTTPYSQADLDAAHAQGVKEGNAAGATAEQERIADAEADRIRAI